MTLSPHNWSENHEFLLFYSLGLALLHIAPDSVWSLRVTAPVITVSMRSFSKPSLDSHLI
uniref:Uncharacterized protein n=1 Tax=Anguilla anguilla TaxID=7936 RepID=A0A0E9U4P4_ANGAN